MRSTLLVLCTLSLAGLASAADLRNGLYKGRPVVFENIDGTAVLQRDIILGNTADLEAALTAKPKTGNEATGVVSSRNLWPNGTVPYVIDTALPASQQQIVKQAIDHWNTRTPIHLTARGGETNYVRFTTSTSTIACSSSVGMIGGAQSIRLPSGCGVGETIHEIGHAVGLWHEQSRNDRNQFVTVLYEDIDKPSGVQFDQTFEDGRDLGPYDFGSIMHYGAFDFSRDGLAPAIETVPAGVPVGQITALSANDIDAVRRLYGAASGKITVATNPSGLKLRVDGALVDDGRQFDWAAGSQHTVEAPFQGNDQTRYLFGSWSDGGAVTHTLTVAAETAVYTANFVRQHKVQVAISPAGAGSVTLDPQSPDGFYTERSSVFISATPASGFNFQEWSVRPSRSLNPKSITITGPTTVATTFTTVPVTTFTSSPIGRIVRVDGTQYSTPVNFAWRAGESHTVTVDPPTEDFQKFRFTGWNDTGATDSRTVVAAANPATYTANFVTQYELTTRTNAGSNGVSVSPAGDGGYYDEGTTVQVSATPPGRNVFYSWDGDVRGTSNPASVTMNEQKLVYALFATRATPFHVIGAATGNDDSIAPGQMVSIYGDNIGPATPAGLQVAGGRVTTSLGGVEVLFDGQAAPLTYVSANQINAIAPYAVRNRTATTVQIRLNGQTSASLSVPVIDSMPGIFTVDSTGRGQAAALNDNGTPNSLSNPARRGSILVLYATGEGVASPAVADGQVNSSVFPKPVAAVSVRIGGQPAVVHYAGAAPGFVAGVMQINVQIPAGVKFGPNVPVSVVIGNQASPSGVTVAVQ